MLRKVFRVVFAILGMLFGYGASSFMLDNIPGVAEFFGEYAYLLFIPISVVLFGIIFFYFYPWLHKQGKTIIRVVLKDAEKVPISEALTATGGLLVGLFVAFLISQIINGIKVLQTAYINVIISVLLYIGLGYTGLTLGRRAAGELKPLFGGMASGRETAKKRGKSKVQGASPKILDTSVIIDGRVVDILKTGFLEGSIVIPDFVLVELRHIADSGDGLKRARGRRGLDVLNKIRTDYGVDIYETSGDKVLDDIPEVDVKLLKLAQMINGIVVTNDFNLNKVAGVQDVGVLNINELSNALKPVVLPGESLQVFLVKEGKENGQAVAYLDDGTMIVVENAKKLIGQTVNTTVTSVLQTSAGRMIFAKP